MAGSRDLDFQTHPAAAIQHVAGALVAPGPGGGEQDGRGDGLYGEALTPVDLARALSASHSRFRESLDDWKKACRRLQRPDKTAKDTAAAILAVEVVRGCLESDALSLAAALCVAHAHIRRCAVTLMGNEFQLHLGVPAPLGTADIEPASKQWHSALAAAGAYDGPQDPDLPHLLARADALTDEALASLKEITRQAKWLWTNEPAASRVVSLLVWMFDLRCECLELPPVLACLQTPLEVWLAAAQAAARELLSPSGADGAPAPEALAEAPG